MKITNVQELRTRKGSNNQNILLSGYTTEGDGGGGEFYWDALSSETDNGGTIFQVTGVATGRWKRIIKDCCIVPEYFGAKGDGATDDYDAFRAALDFAKDDDIVQKIILGRKKYVLNTTLNIDTEILIEGQRGYTEDSSVMFFPYPTSGIVIDFPVMNEMRGVVIESNNSSADNENHIGALIRGVVRWENVNVTGFAGTGIYLDGRYPPYNVDHSHFVKVSSRANGLDGWYAVGGDANIIKFDSCEAVSNGARGWSDQSFLGNLYINCHSASNSSPELSWQKSLCQFSGVVYSAIKSGVLGQPDITPTDWYELPAEQQGWTVFPFVQEYDSEKEYRAGGAYNLDEDNTLGRNQFATLVGCYSEYDQPAAYVSEKCICVGGNIGGLLRTGTFIFGVNENLFSNSPILVTRGTEPLQAKVHNEGLGLGLIANSTQGIYMNWDEDNKWLTFSSALGFPGTSSYGTDFIIPSQSVDFAALGRGENDVLYRPLMRRMFLRENDVTGQYKSFSVGNVAPVTNAWRAGDTIFNGNPTTGEPLGWRCTTSGTPGTWETINIYTQQTINDYSSDTESSSYTGINNGQAGTVYAQLSDLNNLRTAYENLRASYDDLRTKLINSGIITT